MSLTIGWCDACSDGSLEGFPPRRPCRACGRVIHIHCLALDGEWERVSWEDGIPPEACPFCSGQHIHPQDLQFIWGYTRGLERAGVNRLTLKLIEPLLKFKRANLDLQFITRVDEDAAKALCSQRGDVMLGQADSSVFDILKQRDGHVSEMVLTLALAEQFLEDKASVNLLDYYTIEDEAAETLCKAKDTLWLDGLTRLTDASAASLSKSDFEISLGGLTTISDTAAAALAKHRVELYLGITSLSDAAAAALAKSESVLIFSVLPMLSDTAAEALANHSGELFLGIVELTDAVAAALAKHRGRLVFSRLSELSDNTAKALAKTDGPLIFHSVKELSDTAAAALSTHKGEICFLNLETISCAGAIALLRHGNVRTFDLDLNSIAAQNLMFEEWEWEDTGQFDDSD